MRVNAYRQLNVDLLPTGASEDQCFTNVELSECIERDDPEYSLALMCLNHIGRYWGGGGASPLFLLTRVNQ